MNNSPREYWVNVYNWILGITSCNDRPLWQNNGDTTRASCGYQFDNSGNVVKYSEVCRVVLYIYISILIMHVFVYTIESKLDSISY